ncbi:non-specific serine/threonine protein kinase [Ranunculus cassubicifolius]
MDVSSFFFNCVCLLLVSSLKSVEAAPSTVFSRNQPDRFALLAIKSQIQDPWGALSSWNESLHHCEWQGITCSAIRTDRVTALDLQSLKLEGTLSPYIGNLTFLRQVMLSENNFHGEIPQEIGHLFRLELLSLTNNSFTGNIPTNLTRCSNLKVIQFNDNNLSGTIPGELSSLTKLESLFLSINDFVGYIPPSLGNLSSLTQLSLARNRLDGSITEELCLINSLAYFQVGGNNLTGQVPSCIYNQSKIDFFSIAANQLEGTLPPNIGHTLPYVRAMFMGGNKFTGLIPLSLSNATRLETISLDANYFTGSIPNDLGRLQNLSNVWFNSNRLGTNTGDDLKFITSLTNCTDLNSLDISENSLKGPLPDSISNITKSFSFLYAGDNHIYGSIPVGIVNLVNLQLIQFYTNQLTGNLPTLIGKLDKLVKLSVRGNTLSGEIPASIGNLTQLTTLQFGWNNFSGRIPSTLGNCQNLLVLELSHNHLNGSIPKEVVSLSSLTVGMNLQNNFLTGSLPPEVGLLTKIETLAISENQLSGNIPETLGRCLGLVQLAMDGNFFHGEIPKSLSALRDLLSFDVSRNNLSGEIPEYLEQLPLQYLNLSFNQLEGNVPVKGVFGNTSMFSVVGNKQVCGGVVALQLHSCVQNSKRTSFSVKVFVPVIVGSLCLIVFSCFILVYCRRAVLKTNPSSRSANESYKRVSYTDLLRATNGFSSENLIGVGSYGSVFKATLQETDHTVAVKVLDLHREGASKSFLTECNALRNVRHRNLLKIITSCSSMDSQGNDFKAIVFELMLNGNLEEWLHPKLDEMRPELRNLSLIQRLNIATDVASALEYLHHYCQPGIVHCDLKPSNVLLDGDMIAHVADFGIAKMFSTISSDSAQSLASSLVIKGSIGYVAPEYGTGGEVTAQGDVYSYGILLLEMFTGKKPVDDMFVNGLTLHKYAGRALPNEVTEIVDPTMFSKEKDEGDTDNKILLSVIKLGVSCSAESPVERMTMKEVMAELNNIRDIF